jgi:1,4-dihydroxy-6-naphthoate synthase
MTTDPGPLLRIGHSPDPDDVFMWWPLLDEGDGPAIDTEGFRFEAVLADIEALNRRAETGDLEITAMSCAQYPHVQDTYALTACGASMGDAYGPKLVAAEPMEVEALTRPGCVIAVPGERTSAFGATSLILGAGAFAWETVPFDEIIERVADGTYPAGLVIHEGQLTFEAAGLHLVEDVGRWWSATHDGLPLPLGVNTIRRDLDDEHGPGTIGTVTSVLRRSVEHALAHRPESIRRALAYARGMGADLADEFVSMYVNAWTLDFGPTGLAGVRRFLDELDRIGLVPATAERSFVTM